MLISKVISYNSDFFRSSIEVGVFSECFSGTFSANIRLFLPSLYPLDFTKEERGNPTEKIKLGGASGEYIYI